MPVAVGLGDVLIVEDGLDVFFVADFVDADKVDVGFNIIVKGVVTIDVDNVCFDAILVGDVDTFDVVGVLDKFVILEVICAVN